MYNKLVPYNTGKVLIGVRYEVPQRPPEMDADAVYLQRALLGKHTGARALINFITNRKENNNA